MADDARPPLTNAYATVAIGVFFAGAYALLAEPALISAMGESFAAMSQ